MSPEIPRRIKLFVWGGVSAFVLAVVAVAATLIYQARQVALVDAASGANRFVASAEAALNRSFLAVDVLLASMDEILELSGVRQEWLDPEVASQRLRSSARQNLMVRYVALLDEKGRVIASSDAAGASLSVSLPAGLADLVFSQPVPMLTVSAPAVSFVSAEKVLYMARPMALADGSRMLAVAQVPVVALAGVLTQGMDIPGLQVTLERTGGQALLTLPRQEEGEKLLLSPPLAELDATGPAWQARARLGGEPALVVYRPLMYQDLRIAASVPRHDALTAWRSTRDGIVLTTLGFVAMMILVGAVSMRYLDRMTQARVAIAHSKATLDEALESMVSGFVLLDSQMRLVQWNRRFEEIYPWLKGHLAPQIPFRELLMEKARHHLENASPEEQLRWVEQRVAVQRNPQGPHEQGLPDGRVIQVTERPTPDAGLVITYHDVTELRRASAEIENLAFYDPLTGLPNRRLLMDRIQQAVAANARSGQHGALLFLDLDHFKTLNDTLGHEVGDMLLRQVAERLRACVRTEDTVARLGGDEFVVMLKNLAASRNDAASLARRVAEKILRRLNMPYALGAHLYHSTPSIGATLIGLDMQPPVDLLKQADIAMYQVKSQGRNSLCFFDPQMQVAINQRVQLENDLQKAIFEGEFELHYQPQQRLDGRIVGVEGLVRWRHPERGLIAPGGFIAVAEESELIVPIGYWVLRTACAQLAAWKSDPRYQHVQVSVNVSARQFRQPDFVERVVEILRETGAQAHLLKLELTESLVLDDVDDTIAKMEQLKTKGVRFSVDDFGTGYSSLAYLTRLPLDQLKIDQSFVRNLGAKQTDDVIVQTIIGMARNLELDVIAEGVETVEQRDTLARYGCHYFQGYLLGKPMPLHELEALLGHDPALPAVDAA
ncbi:EAL domain-containing protein [Acidovorax sp. DW039]|uniref:bifunctional diguanylate cyclase/phosphodiesterase n=1 Tax=Acidovorax sp. DW039 TaxID=3095606 RepID=UPI00308AAA5A|nr:EAL domain-containing protein [Acidovorax sp. DW039]